MNDFSICSLNATGFPVASSTFIAFVLVKSSNSAPLFFEYALIIFFNPLLSATSTNGIPLYLYIYSFPLCHSSKRLVYVFGKSLMFSSTAVVNAENIIFSVFFVSFSALYFFACSGVILPILPNSLQIRATANNSHSAILSPYSSAKFSCCSNLEISAIRTTLYCFPINLFATKRAIIKSCQVG